MRIAAPSPPRAARAPSETSAAAAAERGGCRIMIGTATVGSQIPALLVVDDDPGARELYAELFRPLCCEIDEAGDGIVALAKLGERRYSAIIMDLHMPSVDGLGVLDAIQLGATPNRDTPFIVVTGDASIRARVEVLRRKTVFLFNKPVDVESLLATVRQAITARTPSS
jgi:CheY-like chemotaxis protein